MPTPTVFISSTCYDLKYIRENLKYFVRSIGYTPILSEEGSIFYDPKLEVQDACLAEVASCQIFILIIGGRFGNSFRDTEISVTNAEYKEAVKNKIPIFALVERDILDQYRLFQSNKANPDVDEQRIVYPAVDSTRIFDFIEEGQRNSVNNALVPFVDFEDIQSYLKQQWAGMMYRFLTSESEAKKVEDTVSTLSAVSQKIEFLTKQILTIVADPVTNALGDAYDLTLETEHLADAIKYWHIPIPTPAKVLKYPTFRDFLSHEIGNVLSISPDTFSGSASIGEEYSVSENFLLYIEDEYRTLRMKYEDILEKNGLTIEQYLQSQRDNK